MEFLKKENFNIPNILSFIRIIIIVPFVLYFLNDDYLLAALMLIFSGLSDMFDGLIARKLNQITKLGKVLDPVADKLTLTAVIICMGIKFPEIFPLVIILILKDVSMLIAGSFLLKKGIEPPAAKWYGKLSTVFFYISVIIFQMEYQRILLYCNCHFLCNSVTAYIDNSFSFFHTFDNTLAAYRCNFCIAASVSDLCL